MSANIEHNLDDLINKIETINSPSFSLIKHDWKQIGIYMWLIICIFYIQYQIWIQDWLIKQWYLNESTITLICTLLGIIAKKIIQNKTIIKK